jgi:hypothetical protein
MNVSGAGALAFLIAMSACGGGPYTNNYGAAGVGLGAAVAGAVGYRAITGGCVAQCTPGHVCDRQSGLCVPSECSPSCPAGQQCQRDSDGRMICVDDGLTMSLMAARRSASADGGAAPTDASSTSDGGAR